MKIEMHRGCLRLTVLSLSLGLTHLACGDPLKDPQALENIRALGVRVQAESGPATPAAGEATQVSFLLAGPDGPVDLEVAFEVCPAVDAARGVAPCADSPWASGSAQVADDTPVIDFVVPEDVSGETRFVVHAVACSSGNAELAPDPLDWSCSDGSEPVKVSFDAWTAGDETNQNPELAASSLFVGEQQLALEEIGMVPSCDADVPRVKTNTTETMRLTLPETAREETDSGEALQISHFSTSGLLERQFSILDVEEDLTVSIDWETPEEPGPAKHYVVVRDGRSGVSWLSSSVCVED